MNKIFILLLLLTIPAFANSHIYNMTHTIKSHSIAVGDAFTAVSSGLNSTMFNPATLGLNKFTNTVKYNAYLNPTGAYSLIDEYGDITDSRNMESMDYVHLFGSVFKGFTFARPAFSAALVLSEPLMNMNSLSIEDRNRMISSKYLLDSNYDILTLKLELAEQIAIGASGFLFTTSDDSSFNRQNGTSYGVFLKPYPFFAVGVCYFDVPKNVSEILFQNNRLLDETINVGIQFTVENLAVNLDVRNVSDEEKHNIREVHTGLEYNILNVTSLRCGYYYEQENDTHVYSAGFGLLNNNFLHSIEDSFINNDFAINYGIQYRKGPLNNIYYHYLGFLLRF